MKKYLIKIFLKKTLFQFTLDLLPDFTIKSLYDNILDFMGKISKEELEKCIITKDSISNFFYITYEEVERDIIVPDSLGQENKLGSTVEQVIS